MDSDSCEKIVEHVPLERDSTILDYGGKMRDYYLREYTPAETFSDAYYMGNGRLGLTSRGTVPQETLHINDDTLWSGSESFHKNAQHYECMLEARKKVLSGNVKEANQIINDEMEGRWFETYLPMADLHLTVGQRDNRRNMPLKQVIEPEPGDISEYERKLDLSRAVCSVSWKRNEINYQQQYFVSYPEDAAFVLIQARGKEEHCLNLAFGMDSKLHAVNGTMDKGAYVRGIAPDHAEPSYTTITPSLVYNDPEESKALRFVCCAEVFETNGKVWADGCRVYVNDADYVWIIIKAGTSYEGFQKKRFRGEKEIQEELQKEIQKFKRKKCSGEQVFAEHQKDYQTLYNRVDLDLGRDRGEKMATSQRMVFSTGGMDDPSLYALYFQYARYLIISGSRPESQPLNLQGIWNDITMPPWSSNYTNNINVEMNYWLAEAGNLSECHLPLMKLIRELSIAGKQTAKEYYHSAGWVTHHNTDLWRSTEPSCEDASWSWWPLGGGWLCEHIWQHYEYTGDKKFLEEMYPVLKGACEFLLEQLVENGDGYLVTAPSISPENKFFMGNAEELDALAEEMAAGSRCSSNHPKISAVTQASTMDMSILRELFQNTIQAGKILDEKKDLENRLKAVMQKFPPYKIGRYGQLLEWYEDYEECTPGMGHISHLYPVYPSSIINEEKTPELLEAARKSLERRILHEKKECDWPGAWRVSLMARFKNSLECGHILKSIGENFGCGLLTKGSQQIDAIFGTGAGVKEMLLQSHQGYLEILPCIPVDWPDGNFRGLCARGGYEVSAVWKEGQLQSAVIFSKNGGSCRVKADGLKEVEGMEGLWDETHKIYTFVTEPGKEYHLLFECRQQKEYFV